MFLRWKKAVHVTWLMWLQTWVVGVTMEPSMLSENDWVEWVRVLGPMMRIYDLLQLSFTKFCNIKDLMSARQVVRVVLLGLGDEFVGEVKLSVIGIAVEMEAILPEDQSNWKGVYDGDQALSLRYPTGEGCIWWRICSCFCRCIVDCQKGRN